jgi:tetratricopeptide (TPR) repeat protein
VLIPLDASERLARCIEEAEALCRRLEDQRRLAHVLALNTRHALTWRDPPAVVEAAERAYAVAQQPGDPEQIGDATYLLSLAAYFVGDVRRAVAIARQLIADGLDQTRPGAIFTAPRQVLVRAVLARALAELGELEDAARVADEAVSMGTGRRSPYSLIVALIGQGTVCLRRNDAEGAVRAFSRAVELGQEVGYVQLDVPARAGAAIACARLGLVTEAVAELEQILAEATRLRTRLWITLPATWLAEAYLLAGRAVDARTQAESALRLARDRSERVLEGWTLCLLGEIAAHPDTFGADAGLAACEDALAIAESGELRPLAAHAHLAAAVLHARSGRRDAAREARNRARQLCAACHIPVHEHEALAEVLTSCAGCYSAADRREGSASPPDPLARTSRVSDGVRQHPAAPWSKRSGSTRLSGRASRRPPLARRARHAPLG